MKSHLKCNVESCRWLGIDNFDNSDVASVGEVVIACAHVAVLPRLPDAEARRIAGGWGIVQLILERSGSGVASFVEEKIQPVGILVVDNLFNHFSRQAGTRRWFERAASFFYPTHVCAIRTWNMNNNFSISYSAVLQTGFSRVFATFNQ